jgi:putative inorganic carbon (hco3(-)) transporter
MKGIFVGIMHKNSIFYPATATERVFQVFLWLLPWSPEISVGVGQLHFPAEILVGILALMLLPGALRDMRSLRRLNVFPAGILLWQLWMTFCAVNAAMPVVAWKYWLVESAFLLVFGWGIWRHPEWWQRYWPHLAWSAGLLCIYTLCHHSLFQFRQDQAILAPMPFFPDHTMLAAFLSMLLPYTLWHGKKYTWLSALFILTLLVSGARAAWAAMALAGLAYGARQWTITGKYWWLLPILSGFTGAFVYLHSPHRQADVSWQERLNRYDCALKMTRERPCTGWGPGVYEQAYFSFQAPEKRTRISVDQPIIERNIHTYGRGGGAHSEYWQRAAETGWPGLALWLALPLWALAQGFTQLSVPFQAAAWYSTSMFMLQALVNNHLHDPRIALLFWAGLAVLCPMAFKRKSPVEAPESS